MSSQNPIACPECHSTEVRRSRRRSLEDHAFGFVGILPWRCESCALRYHARPVPLRHFFYAHCSLCRNMDLERISFEHVPGMGSVLGRILRLSALRCDPCRHKFLSLRPLKAEEIGAPAKLPS